MDHQPVIRPARADEYNAVARLWMASWCSTGLDVPSEKLLAALQERVPREVHNGWSLYVADDGGQLVLVLRGLQDALVNHDLAAGHDERVDLVRLEDCHLPVVVAVRRLQYLYDGIRDAGDIADRFLVRRQWRSPALKSPERTTAAATGPPPLHPSASVDRGVGAGSRERRAHGPPGRRRDGPLVGAGLRALAAEAGAAKGEPGAARPEIRRVHDAE